MIQKNYSTKSKVRVLFRGERQIKLEYFLLYFFYHIAMGDIISRFQFFFPSGYIIYIWATSVEKFRKQFKWNYIHLKRENLILEFVTSSDQDYLLWYSSSFLFSIFCVQSTKVYHFLDAAIPYSSPLSGTLDNQTSFVARVRIGLFPPVSI